jgi:phosphate transport system substrate-binding protein
MKKMKRIVLTVTILALFFTGCATGGGNEIVVVSRGRWFGHQRSIY